MNRWPIEILKVVVEYIGSKKDYINFKSTCSHLNKNSYIINFPTILRNGPDIITNILLESVDLIIYNHSKKKFINTITLSNESYIKLDVFLQCNLFSNISKIQTINNKISYSFNVNYNTTIKHIDLPTYQMTNYDKFINLTYLHCKSIEVDILLSLKHLESLYCHYIIYSDCNILNILKLKVLVTTLNKELFVGNKQKKYNNILLLGDYQITPVAYNIKTNRLIPFNGIKRRITSPLYRKEQFKLINKCKIKNNVVKYVIVNRGNLNIYLNPNVLGLYLYLDENVDGPINITSKNMTNLNIFSNNFTFSEINITGGCSVVELVYEGKFDFKSYDQMSKSLSRLTIGNSFSYNLINYRVFRNLYYLHLYNSNFCSIINNFIDIFPVLQEVIISIEFIYINDLLAHPTINSIEIEEINNPIIVDETLLYDYLKKKNKLVVKLKQDSYKSWIIMCKGIYSRIKTLPNPHIEIIKI